jgi:hypothetical protein
VKVEGYVFVFFAVFLTGCSVVYWWLSEEPTGTTALVVSVGLGALIGGYLLFTARRMPPRPQDLPDAEIADGSGELGSFSPHSYWPVLLSAAAGLFLLGVIFGIWLSLIGAALLVYSVLGLQFQHLSRGPEEAAEDH